MDCTAAKSRLEAFASDRLQGEDREQVANHVAACEECSLEVDLLKSRRRSDPAGDSEWTVDKIFGEGHVGADPEFASADAGGDSESGSNASPPPPVKAASLFDSEGLGQAPAPPHVAPPPASHENPPAPPSNWGFEAAEAKSDGAPPEESLLFAEEALSRTRGERGGRSGPMRLVAWSLGGIAGLGLLGASIWLAVSAHQAPLPVPAGGRASSHPAAHRAPGGATDSIRASLPARAETDPPPERAPSPEPVLAAGVVAAPTVNPASLATPPKAAPSKTASASPPPPAKSPETNPSRPQEGASGGAPTISAAPAPAKKVVAAPPVVKASRAPVAPTPSPKPSDRDVDDMWPTDDPPKSAAASSPGPPVAASPPSAQPTATPPATTPPAVNPIPPATTTPSATAPPPAANPEPAAPLTAIDRLHEATEKAAAAADLDGLRRLREAWKNYLRTAVGPDRSRVKREYADCLWAIQILTGRTDDQREALRAYRDFLLSAPAGGTDPRSAARVRQLEDVLTERR